MDMVHRLNEEYRAWRALKSVLKNRGLGIKAMKCLYEGVIVLMALYESEAWGMRSNERRKVNVLEMKCLRSLVEARIERELASRTDGLGMWKEWMSTERPEGC